MKLILSSLATISVVMTLLVNAALAADPAAVASGACPACQGDLGDRVGVTRQTIAAIEQGKYSPSLEVAFRIAHVFGKPLEEVFQWQQD